MRLQSVVRQPLIVELKKIYVLNVSRIVYIIYNGMTLRRRH